MIIEFMNGHFLSCRVEVDDDLRTGRVYTDTGITGTVKSRQMRESEVTALRTLYGDLMKGEDE